MTGSAADTAGLASEAAGLELAARERVFFWSS